jgi:hypothetical protein
MPLHTTKDFTRRAQDIADRVEKVTCGIVPPGSTATWRDVYCDMMQEAHDTEDAPACTNDACDESEKNSRVCGLGNTGNYFCFGCNTTFSFG